MGSTNKVPICFAGCESLGHSMGCPRSRSDRFAITSHRPRNFVSALLFARSSLSGQRRDTSSAIDVAARHYRPDDARRSVGERDWGQTDRLSRQQIGKTRIHRLGLVLCPPDRPWPRLSPSGRGGRSSRKRSAGAGVGRLVIEGVGLPFVLPKPSPANARFRPARRCPPLSPTMIIHFGAARRAE